MKTTFSILGIAMLAPMLALGGCHHQPAAQTRVGATLQGIVVAQARLVLPAVKGNPGAGYFVLENHGSAPATLVHVDVVGAKTTEMHQTSGGAMQPLAQLLIAPDQQVAFAPGGKHVMAFSLAPTLVAGDTSTIVFHFQDGKATSAPLRIEAAGGGSGDMAGMNMGGKP